MKNKPLKASYMSFLHEELGRAIVMTEKSIYTERLTRVHLRDFDWHQMFDYHLNHLHQAEKDALVRVAGLLAELAYETQKYDSRKTNLHQIILALDGYYDNEQF